MTPSRWVQRIPLGQRQGIAIVQRGDVLIGVSVGDGGVRTLFTMPATPLASPAAVPADQDTSVNEQQRAVNATGTLQFPGIAAANTGTPTPRMTCRSARASARCSVTRCAARCCARCSCCLVPLARRLCTRRLRRTGTCTSGTATRRRNAGAHRYASRCTGRRRWTAHTASRWRAAWPARPAAASRSERAGTAARKPSPTASRTGGEATISPLLPAAQARDIAALQKRAEGNAPLTTPEAQRIAGRADSMISKLAPQMELKLGGNAQGEGLRLSGTVGVVIMMGLLSMLPVLLLMMTASPAS